MKHEDDEARLDRLLRGWAVNEPLPPRFQDRVWQRIEASEARAATGGRSFWPDWLTVLFARPALTMVCAGVLLVVGVSAGVWRAERDSARWDNQLAQRYVASVDPYLNQR